MKTSIDIIINNEPDNGTMDCELFYSFDDINIPESEFWEAVATGFREDEYYQVWADRIELYLTDTEDAQEEFERVVALLKEWEYAEDIDFNEVYS